MTKLRQFEQKAAVALLLLGAVLCFLFSCFSGIIRMQGISSVTVMGNTPLLPGKTLLALLQKEGADTVFISAAGWNRLGIQTVREPKLQREFPAEVLQTAGDIRLLTTAAYVSGGAYTYQDDTGCVLSVPLAQALFQSTEVIGLPVAVGADTYYIRGVLKEAAPLLFFGAQQENTVFQYLELSFRDQRNGWQNAKNLLSQFGIYQDYTLLDGAAAHEITRVLALFPLWLAILLGVLHGLRLCRRQLSGWRRWLGWAGILAAGGLLLCLTGFSLQIPDSMFPNKWSDFSFYTAKSAEIGTSVQQLLRLPATLTQLFVRDRLGKTSLYSLLAMSLGLSCTILWSAQHRCKFNEPRLPHLSMHDISSRQFSSFKIFWDKTRN